MFLWWSKIPLENGDNYWVFQKKIIILFSFKGDIPKVVWMPLPVVLFFIALIWLFSSSLFHLFYHSGKTWNLKKRIRSLLQPQTHNSSLVLFFCFWGAFYCFLSLSLSRKTVVSQTEITLQWPGRHSERDSKYNQNLQATNIVPLNIWTHLAASLETPILNLLCFLFLLTVSLTFSCGCCVFIRLARKHVSRNKRHCEYFAKSIRCWLPLWLGLALVFYLSTTTPFSFQTSNNFICAPQSLLLSLGKFEPSQSVSWLVPRPTGSQESNILEVCIFIALLGRLYSLLLFHFLFKFLLPGF